MMQTNSVSINSRALNSDLLYWQSQIVNSLGAGAYALAEGIDAQCAVSCVVVPEQGDSVLCYRDDSGAMDETYILAVLRRQPSQNTGTDAAKTARLSVPGCDNLKISQASIQCHASKQIELGCVKDIKLTSVQGNVEVRAQNLIQTLVGSIVESAAERISNANFIQFCASFLTRIHSNQTVMTADADIKIDAERVNLG